MKFKETNHYFLTITKNNEKQFNFIFDLTIVKRLKFMIFSLDILYGNIDIISNWK